MLFVFPSLHADNKNETPSLVMNPSTPFVWLFFPYADDPRDEYLDPNYNHLNTVAEFRDALDMLGLPFEWRLVSMDNYESIVEEVRQSASERPAIVFNMVDGDEINSFPGISVVHLLAKTGLTFTGADARFYHITTSKITMKAAFVEAGVPTPPFEVIRDPESDTRGLTTRLGAPLIVKPAVSAASTGVSLKSVVQNDTAAAEQARMLMSDFRGWQFEEVFAEQFINGPEFTIFLVGSVHRPDQIRIYPPVERVFHSQLLEHERFLSFDRYWELYEDESPLSPDEPFYRYCLAPENIAGPLTELSKQAFLAVFGTGYARVDIRMDRESGKLYVLEVNSQCGLSGDPKTTSLGNILHLSGATFDQLLAEIIGEAVLRFSSG